MTAAMNVSQLQDVSVTGVTWAMGSERQLFLAMAGGNIDVPAVTSTARVISPKQDNVGWHDVGGNDCGGTGTTFKVLIR